VRRKIKPLLTFVQDTREQTPFSFAAPVRASDFEDGGTITMGLGEGDYSVMIGDSEMGECLPIRIERKNLGDLFMCCGSERDRFVRELERLTVYQQRDLVVEATANQILAGYERSRIPGRSVMASLACWRVQYGLAIWFGENHRRAGGLTQRILEEFAFHFAAGGAGGIQPILPADRGRGEAPLSGDTVRVDAAGET
jgi:hypothetical protein